jgi:hypothetical protein
MMQLTRTKPCDLRRGLILGGSDHFDIHHDVDRLEKKLSSVVKKIGVILHHAYGVTNVHPVAYRVNTAAPSK